MIRPIVFDAETLPITHRPRHPPEPVSFSLQLPTWKKPKFYAWGHKTGGNNCTFADAKRVLKEVWNEVSEQRPILCHNAKFDLDVAETHMGCRALDWREHHDTMFLLFLSDPHARELALKPAAERLLGMAPDERDSVAAWVLEHKKELERDFPEITTIHGGIKPSTASAFIAYVPGNIVEPYANGDVDRTGKIFKLVHPEILERGMGAAYDRERQLMPILLRNEREGLRVDTPAMERDLKIYTAAQTKTDAWIRKALKAPGLNLDSNVEMAAALKARDAVTQWTRTATGKDSTSKKNLKIEHFRDRKLAAAYSYRQKCGTLVETFLNGWLRYTHGDRLHTNWNQVRQASTGGIAGARTGRPSTNNPNFLNMPKKVKGGESGERRGFLMPTHIDVPELPKVRSYILPDVKGHVIGRRDLSQQEVRILAHYEGGELQQAFMDDPLWDIHDYVTEKIADTMGTEPDRDTAKTLNLAYIYSQSVGSMAEVLNKPVDEVRRLRAIQNAAVPGLQAISDGFKDILGRGEPIVTWGGREYYCEPPAYSKKFARLMDYSYKGCNVACQSSAADITKEAIIRYDAARKHGRFMLSVYDEIDASVPKKALKEEMLIMRECMLSIELDVPMLSDGEWGPNLGDLQPLAEPPFDLSRWGIKQ